MINKQRAIIDVLSESGRRILAEVKAETSREGLLDLMSSDGPGCTKMDSDWTDLPRRPNIKEIDYTRTSDDMIVEGKVILKDRRRVSWLRFLSP